MLCGSTRLFARSQVQAWRCTTEVARHVTRTYFHEVTAETCVDESELHWQMSPTNPFKPKRKRKWNMTYEMRYLLKSRPGAEEAAHNMTERVPIDRDYQADHARWWNDSSEKRKSMLLASARRFKIFDHLSEALGSNLSEIYLRNSLGVEYEVDGTCIPVVSGNNFLAGVTARIPRVHWHTTPVTEIPQRVRKLCRPRDPLSKYTIAMLSLDGNLEHDHEKLHWLVSNATGGSVEQGTEVCSYAQVMPFKKTGWHRFVFLLLHQKDDITLSANALDNQRDVFSVDTFIKAHDLSIDGFCFGQATWDPSVSEAYMRVHGVPISKLQAQPKPDLGSVNRSKKASKRYNHLAKSKARQGRTQ